MFRANVFLTNQRKFSHPWRQQFISLDLVLAKDIEMTHEHRIYPCASCYCAPQHLLPFSGAKVPLKKWKTEDHFTRDEDSPLLKSHFGDKVHQNTDENGRNKMRTTKFIFIMGVWKKVIHKSKHFANLQLTFLAIFPTKSGDRCFRHSHSIPCCENVEAKSGKQVVAE